MPLDPACELERPICRQLPSQVRRREGRDELVAVGRDGASAQS